MAFRDFLKSLISPLSKLRAMAEEIFVDKNMEAVCVWKIIIPFLLLVLVAPILSVIFPTLDYPVQRAFAHGDLLIFSGLILIEAAIELNRAEMKYSELLRGLATLMIFSFGFVKIGAMLREHDLADQKAALSAAQTLLRFSMFNVSMAVLSVVGSLYAFLQAIRKENAKRAGQVA
jgi:hypothetical protein